MHYNLKLSHTVTALALFSASVSICPPSFAQQDSLNQIISAQQAYKQQIHAMSAHIKIDTTANTTTPHPGIQTSELDWGYNGPKIVTRIKVADPKLGTAIGTTLFDGKRSTLVYNQVQPAGKELSYGTVKTTAPDIQGSPATFGYFHLDSPLADVLAKGDAKITGVESDPQFGPLTVVQCTPVRAENGETLRLWFAPKYGWMSVKEEDITPTPENGATNTLSMASTEISKQNGYWVTTAGTEEISHLQGATRSVLTAENISFSDIKVNDVPSSLFKLATPVGTTIDDEDIKQRHLLLANGTWKRVKSPLEEHSVDADLADVPSVNPAYWLFAVSGVCILSLVAIKVWQRKRSTT